MIDETRIGKPGNRSIRVDWNAVKLAYVTDATQTFTSIAKKYKVSSKSVEIQAKKGKWTAERAAFNVRSVKAIEGDLIDERTEANKRHTKIYKNMQALASAELSIAYRQIENYVTNNNNPTLDKDAVISPFNMKNLFEALNMAIEGERVTLGLPNTVTRTELTGKDGDTLFEETNINEIYALAERTATAVAQATSDKNSKQDTSSS